MKPVVARSGDVVSVSKRGVAVNGRAIPNSAPLLKDTANRPLTPWRFGAYTVQPGTVWVVSSYHSRSFDSRYFGPISETRIRGRLRPLLVLRRSIRASRVSLIVLSAGAISFGISLAPVVALLLLPSATSFVQRYHLAAFAEEVQTMVLEGRTEVMEADLREDDTPTRRRRCRRNAVPLQRDWSDEERLWLMLDAIEAAVSGRRTAASTTGTRCSSRLAIGCPLVGNPEHFTQSCEQCGTLCGVQSR